MTLQERVLEALGERALKPRALYDLLRGESATVVDFAISALLKRGAISLELGHYQRTNGKLAAAQEPTAPKTQTVVVSIDSRKSPPPIAMSVSDRSRLTKREREIFELFENGISQKQIMERLGLSKTCVSSHLSNARNKLGIRVKFGAPTGKRPISQSAPSADRPITAAPSHEGAEAATVGAVIADGRIASGTISAAKFTGPGVPIVSIDGAKEQVKARRQYTFSPDLILRLVEQQRSKAMLVQVLCDKLSMAREDLADIEQLVRIATDKGAA